MAYSRTLAELELAVRREADMVNSQFVTSAEVQAYINQSWAELYDRIVLFDQEYLLRYVDIPSSAASSAGEFDILIDGQTGIVISITQPGLPGTGSGYTLNELVYLDAPINANGTLGIGRVTQVSMGGAIQALELVSAGWGYGGSTSTPSGSGALTQLSVLNPVDPGSGGSGAQTTFYIESDFYKCKGIWSSDSSSGSTTFWNPLRRYQWDQQNLLRQANEYYGPGLAALPLYRVYTWNGREKLSIAPMINGTFRAWYYPAPYKMLTDSDRIDGRAGWDEWVVKDSAMKCLLKEESIEQAAAIKVVRDELFSRFQLHASERDASQPEKIRNVNNLSRRAFPWR